MRKQPYTNSYYAVQSIGSLRSARAIVPVVLQFITPRSVVDVGCGIGTWASVFVEHNVQDVWGIDGDYVKRELLLIPRDRFIAWDLTRGVSLGRRFDLVVSLEVAEHLPKESAEAFVDSLTGLGPVVLFSAATPFQGGTHHINEQWQGQWAEVFERKGYATVDCIRSRVWQNSDVTWFYAQNVLMFVERKRLPDYPSLRNAFEGTHAAQLSLLHPQAITHMSVRSLLRLLPGAVRRSVARRRKRLL